MQFNHTIGIQRMLLFIHFYATTKIMDIFCTLAMLLLVKTLHDHDTIAVHLFQKKHIEFLTSTFQRPRKIYYISDSCAAKYKNRKSFINPCHHAEDFDVQT